MFIQCVTLESKRNKSVIHTITGMCESPCMKLHKRSHKQKSLYCIYMKSWYSLYMKFKMYKAEECCVFGFGEIWNWDEGSRVPILIKVHITWVYIFVKTHLYLISIHFKVWTLCLKKALKDIIAIFCYFLVASRKVFLEEELECKHTLCFLCSSSSPKATLLCCIPNRHSSWDIGTSLLDLSHLSPDPFPYSPFLPNPYISIKYV